MYIYISSSSRAQKWSEVEATHSFPQQVFPTPPRVTPTSFCGSNSTPLESERDEGERERKRRGKPKCIAVGVVEAVVWCTGVACRRQRHSGAGHLLSAGSKARQHSKTRPRVRNRETGRGWRR